MISDHGDAWKGALEDDGNGGWMSLPQIQQALGEARQKTGHKLDLLSFDCCYMGSLEVAHQLRDEARYMVSSQEEVGWHGHSYQQVLQGIDSLTPRQLAEKLVESGRDHPKEFMTLAAVDLEKIPQVSQAVTQLGQAMAVQSPDCLMKAVDKTQRMWEYHDASDLASQLGQALPALQPAADQVRQAIAEAVVAEQHDSDHPGAHGLHIETKLDTEKWGYAETAFARETGWDKVIAHLRS